MVRYRSVATAVADALGRAGLAKRAYRRLASATDALDHASHRPHRVGHARDDVVGRRAHPAVIGHSPQSLVAGAAYKCRLGMLGPQSGGMMAVMMDEREHPVNGPLERLIGAWCDRRDLRPLALLLPAYTSNAGLTDDWARVMEALRDLRARARLPEGEQAEVERLVPIVERMVYRS